LKGINLLGLKRKNIYANEEQIAIKGGGLMGTKSSIFKASYLIFLVFFGVSCFTSVLLSQEEKKKKQEVPLEKLLNTKISTAAKYEQTSSEAAASVTIVTAEDIRRFNYRTLDEILMNIRGFYLSNDRNYSYLGTRGFSRPTDYNNRILLQINGHSMNDSINGAVSIGTDLAINPDIIERIEIVRGPSSALYGTGAMFAVINIITKKGNMVDGFGLNMEMGSYGRLSAAAAYGRNFDSGIDMSFSGLWTDIKGHDNYYEEYDDPSTNSGIAEDLDWDKNFGFQMQFKYKDFTLHSFVTSRKKAFPTGAWEVIFNDDRAATLDEQSYIELKYDHDIRMDKRIMVRGYYDYYNYEGWYPVDIFWFETATEKWVGGEFQFLWDPWVNNRLIVGTEYQKHLRADYKMWDEEGVYFDDDFPFSVFSFYIHDEYQVTQNFSLTFGLRHDYYSDAGGSTTPRAAIVYHPAKSSTLKLLYGNAFRKPSIYEMNYDDPLGGYKHNLNLKPERIRTFEFIWEQRLSDELYGIISIYDYRMKDLIDQEMDPSDFLIQYRNLSKVNAFGAEFELSARLKSGFFGYVSYSYQNAENPAFEEKLTNSPTHLLKAGFSLPVFNNFYAGAQLLYETERITVYDTETDPYLLAALHFSTERLLGHIRFSFVIKNLFNVSYELPGGFEHVQSAILQDGRNLWVKAEFKF
jgi:outer membrane receptor for ferrienterochelin and colicins